jgi:hypothetical protein
VTVLLLCAAVQGKVGTSVGYASNAKQPAVRHALAIRSWAHACVKAAAVKHCVPPLDS